MAGRRVKEGSYPDPSSYLTDLMMTEGRGPSPTKHAVARGLAAPMSTRQQGHVHVRAVLLPPVWRPAQIRSLNLSCAALSAAARTSATPPSARRCPVAVQTTSLVASHHRATLSLRRPPALASPAPVVAAVAHLAPVPSFLRRPAPHPTRDPCPSTACPSQLTPPLCTPCCATSPH